MSKNAFKRMRRHLKMEVCRKPLDSYAWPGAYPLYYFMSDGSSLCPDCVNKEIASVAEATLRPDRNTRDWQCVGVDANWENDHLYCDHCNKRIESAYGHDDTELDAMAAEGVETVEELTPEGMKELRAKRGY